MDEVCAQHPSNPEVWGRKSQLLYQLGKVEEAEDALEKAFAINPTYPFGFYLRGRFRHIEGEIPGALLLFRKAAEAYDPIAQAILAQVYSFIADCELKLNRPVAARAALEMTARLEPTNPEHRASIDEVFGKDSALPSVARRLYTLRSLASDAPAEKRAAWASSLEKAGTGKLTDAVKAFEQLTMEFGDDPAAWYNLGLAKGWLGDNTAAIAALQKSVELDSDEEPAADAWALAEVLLLGYGLEEQADYVRHIASFAIQNMNSFFAMLKEMEEGARLLGMQSRPEEGILAGMVLEKVTGLTLEHAATKTPRLGAFLTVFGQNLRLTNVNRDRLHAVAEEFRQKAPGALSAAHWQKQPPNFAELLGDAIGYPVRAADEADAKKRMVEFFANYMEEEWIHIPRKSLGNVPPIDAAGHPVLRKKLRGIIGFVADCSDKVGEMYDFDRLRRKVGLLEGGNSATASVGAPATLDIGAFGAADLAALNAEVLSDPELEQAFQTAKKLDAGELAGKFARLLVGRPPTPEHPDRYAAVNHLVQSALAEGNTDAALAAVAEGEKIDSEHNGGKHANDFALRRGQLYAKRGEIDKAMAAFEQLIAQAPGELRYRGSAVEWLLAAKQPAKALQFAEEGLKKSREQNNRDSEQYFLELAGAAKKQGG
jgi:tetratricopeptide (TPR) repeat protein